MTVPSGKVVASSRTSRPFWTRARRGLIQLLYGFPKRPASVWLRRTRRPAETINALVHDFALGVPHDGAVGAFTSTRARSTATSRFFDQVNTGRPLAKMCSRHCGYHQLK